ncbi:TonB-dependent receptor [bacterium]|nr:TonB-dependent receptor [bacterium]
MSSTLFASAADPQKLARSLIGWHVVACLLLVGLPNFSRAESESDSLTHEERIVLPDYELPDTVVVSATRSPQALVAIPSSIEIRSIQTEDYQSTWSIANMLDDIGGIRTIPAGNLWGHRDVDVRGFYGGGQSEYLLVMYEGIPLNDFSTGLAAWELSGAIQPDRVEVIKGPVSAAYGDFGVGGLIALSSNRDLQTRFLRVTSMVGSDNANAYRVKGSTQFGRQSISLAAGFGRNNGWRSHSTFESFGLGLTLRTDRDWGYLAGIAMLNRVIEEVPGALTPEILGTEYSSEGFDLFGRPVQDSRDQSDLLLAITGLHRLSPTSDFGWSGFAKFGKQENVLTLTSRLRQDPELSAVGLRGYLQKHLHLINRPVTTLFGTEFDFGRLSTRYWDMEEPGTTLVESGEGDKSSAAIFVETRWSTSSRITLIISTRLDYTKSDFAYDQSATHALASSVDQESTQATYRVALNSTFSRKSSGFVSYASSFKSPTLNHLYSSPPFFAQTPYFTGYLSLSNPSLQAMRGHHWEVGCRWSDALGHAFQVTAFLYNLRNEIDFDLATMHYENIGESRHFGVDIAGKARVVPALELSSSLSLVSARIRSGDQEGNLINGVPELSFSSSMRLTPLRGSFFEVTVRGCGAQWLDQANTARIAGFAIAAIRTGIEIGSLRVVGSVENLLNRRVPVSGYLGLMDEERLYPAPPRSFLISVAAEL